MPWKIHRPTCSKRALKALAAMIAAAILPIYPAPAQQFLDPGTGALAGYAGPGIRSGDYLMHGWVSSGVAYDSKLYDSHTNPIQDWIFFVTPTGDITHFSGRNTEELIASATSAWYASNGADNYTDIF